MAFSRSIHGNRGCHRVVAGRPLREKPAIMQKAWHGDIPGAWAFITQEVRW